MLTMLLLHHVPANIQVTPTDLVFFSGTTKRQRKMGLGWGVERKRQRDRDRDR